MPPAAADDCEELREARVYFTQLVQGTDDPAGHPEGVRFGVSLAQVVATRGLGDKPLSVVSAGRSEPYSADFPAHLGAHLDRLREAQQEELVRLSSVGQRMIARQSGHMIPEDQPEIVVEAIRRVVEAVRPG